MTTLEEHPYGQRCVNGLYATFDPDFEGMSFMTVPWHEDDNFVVWLFTADWMGEEDIAGEPVAGGLVSVSKQQPIISVYTWYPEHLFSMVMVPEELD